MFSPAGVEPRTPPARADVPVGLAWGFGTGVAVAPVIDFFMLVEMHFDRRDYQPG